MRLVIAPDGFGGTLSPGRRRAAPWPTAGRRRPPRDEVDLCPLSDGGPGPGRGAAAALPGSAVVPVVVEDALARPVPAAVAAAGRHARRTSRARSPAGCTCSRRRSATRRATTTYGVGQLLLAALDAGATRVVVGLGGSATNDGGAGMLAALGLGARRRRGGAAGTRAAPRSRRAPR